MSTLRTVCIGLAAAALTACVTSGGSVGDPASDNEAANTLLTSLGGSTSSGGHVVDDLMRLQKEAAKRGGRVIVLTGNHEAMNVTGDLRYTVPGEFAAFATSRSAELRDRLYEAKKADIEAQYRAKDPALTSEAIRDAWMKATPLGWVEQRLAWAPDGEIGKWVARNPAVALVDGNLFVHGGLSAEYSKLSIDDINRNSPLRPVFYGFDLAEVDAEGQKVLQSNADVLRKYSSWQISIEGHCDERGTAEYNLALGERRAVAARNYLVSLGISADRVKTVSYGKEFPFDPGHDEGAWAKNRRSHFVVTAK